MSPITVGGGGDHFPNSNLYVRKLIRHSELKKEVEEKIKAMSFMGKDRDGVCDNWKHGVGGQKVARMLIAATSKGLYFIIG